jgi:hypothetical protein
MPKVFGLQKSSTFEAADVSTDYLVRGELSERAVAHPRDRRSDPRGVASGRPGLEARS